MFNSPLDSQTITVNTKSTYIYETTHFSIEGSILEIEGYASIKGVYAYSEDRIRKTLLMVQEVDIRTFRERLREEQKEKNYDELELELTDEEIIDMHTVKVPLENCKFKNVKNNKMSKIDDNDSLGGFKGSIDLSKISDGKPLTEGNYNIYILLEQLSNEDDSVKYEKIIPIADIQKFIKNGIITTKLYYFSATQNLKYNLICQFNLGAKTLKFENKLLQSYDPREMTEDGGLSSEHRIIQSIKRRFFKLCYIIFSILPVNKKKITIASDSRNDLTGNLYFIYEELSKRNLNIKVKFSLNKRIDNKKTFLNLFITAYHFATSKIILLDDFYPLIYPINIRKNSDLIQVWHAAGAFKTFGFSRVGRPGGPSPNSRNHRNYTKVTVSSESVRKHYAEGFGVSIDKIYATGVPRSDIFFDEEYKTYVKNRLYEKYPFLTKKKVILFAPTFRGNGQASAYFPFHVIDFKALYENLKDDYVFLFKIHPFVNNKLTIPYEYSDFFYDFSEFREINDLLLVTDILITDYSSVCFEFALLNKPMLFFGFDVEEYIRTRDFYYDYFEFIPGPLVRSTEEIIEKIKQGDFRMDKIKPFVKYFFDDTLGKASKNVVDEVIIPSLESEYVREKKVTKIDPPKSRFELFERALKDDENQSE